MSDKIESLPNIGWSPKAALASANERVPDDAQALACMWIDGDGKVRWSVAGTNGMVIWMLEKAKLEVMLD
jgi:hypothetical protein